VRRGMPWSAGLLYMPLEVMSKPALRRRIDDGLRDLRVRVTALVQRAACECSDACRCCQLPGTALALPMYMNVYRFLEEAIFWVKSESSRILSEYIWAGGIQGHLSCLDVCVYMYMLYSCFSPA
jgi:hypothetical protein